MSREWQVQGLLLQVERVVFFLARSHFVRNKVIQQKYDIYQQTLILCILEPCFFLVNSVEELTDIIDAGSLNRLTDINPANVERIGGGIVIGWMGVTVGILILCAGVMFGLMIDWMVAAILLLAYAGSVIGLMTGLTVTLMGILIPYTWSVVMMMSGWAEATLGILIP